MHSKPHYVGGGHEYQLVGYCEIDKYASRAYSQIHGVTEELNLCDVQKVNTILMDEVDIITYGFPCQDISAAGKQRGFADAEGNKTRSGLFFDALRIIEEARPKYAIAENVKALTSKKFEKEFKTVLASLSEAGYNNYWAVLNAKDYGIPQNRERVFIVSIRKDIDKGWFKFPEKMPLNIRVKDILESTVDEKYYINTEKARQLIKKLLDKNRITGVEVCDATVNAPNVRDISNAIISRYDAGISNQRSWGTAVIEPPVICASRGRNTDNPSDRTAGIPTEQRLEPNTDGVSNTLTTVQKDNYLLESAVLRQERTEYGKQIRKAYENGEINEKRSNIRELSPRDDGITNTLTTVQKDNYLLEAPKINVVGNLRGHSQMGRVFSTDGLSGCLSHADAKEPIKILQVGNMVNTGNFENPQRGRIYSQDGLAPALNTCGGGGLEPKFIQPVVIGSTQQHAAVKNDGVCPCLTACMGTGGGQIPMITDNQIDCCGYRIRKLTPLECFRLMGFSDEEFYRIKGVSNTQLYKMAGNSIVVNVLEGIFNNLLRC